MRSKSKSCGSRPDQVSLTTVSEACLVFSKSQTIVSPASTSRCAVSLVAWKSLSPVQSRPVSVPVGVGGLGDLLLAELARVQGEGLGRLEVVGLVAVVVEEEARQPRALGPEVEVPRIVGDRVLVDGHRRVLGVLEVADDRLAGVDVEVRGLAGGVEVVVAGAVEAGLGPVGVGGLGDLLLAELARVQGEGLGRLEVVGLVAVVVEEEARQPRALGPEVEVPRIVGDRVLVTVTVASLVFSKSQTIVSPASTSRCAVSLVAWKSLSPVQSRPVSVQSVSGVSVICFSPSWLAFRVKSWST